MIKTCVCVVLLSQHHLLAKVPAGKLPPCCFLPHGLFDVLIHSLKYRRKHLRARHGSGGGCDMVVVVVVMVVMVVMVVVVVVVVVVMVVGCIDDDVVVVVVVI